MKFDERFRRLILSTLLEYLGPDGDSRSVPDALATRRYIPPVPRPAESKAEMLPLMPKRRHPIEFNVDESINITKRFNFMEGDVGGRSDIYLTPTSINVNRHVNQGDFTTWFVAWFGKWFTRWFPRNHPTIRGRQGVQGPTGPIGRDGLPGRTVKNARVTSEGLLEFQYATYSYVGDTLTETLGDWVSLGSIIGPKGEDGDEGPPGATVNHYYIQCP